MFKSISVKFARFILTVSLLALLLGKPALPPAYVDCVPVDAGNCPTSLRVA